MTTEPGQPIKGRLTVEQFAELLRAIPWPYVGGCLDDPEISDWARQWMGADGGTLALLNDLEAERDRADRLEAELRSAQGRIASALRGHFQYRAAAEDRFDCCAECNRLTGGYVPWPCNTYQALTRQTQHAETEPQ